MKNTIKTKRSREFPLVEIQIICPEDETEKVTEEIQRAIRRLNREQVAKGKTRFFYKIKG